MRTNVMVYSNRNLRRAFDAGMTLLGKDEDGELEWYYTRDQYTKYKQNEWGHEMEQQLETWEPIRL